MFYVFKLSEKKSKLVKITIGKSDLKKNLSEKASLMQLYQAFPIMRKN